MPSLIAHCSVKMKLSVSSTPAHPESLNLVLLSNPNAAPIFPLRYTVWGDFCTTRPGLCHPLCAGTEAICLRRWNGLIFNHLKHAQTAPDRFLLDLNDCVDTTHGRMFPVQLCKIIVGPLVPGIGSMLMHNLLSVRLDLMLVIRLCKIIHKLYSISRIMNKPCLLA